MPDWITSQKCVNKVAACDSIVNKKFSPFSFLLYYVVKTCWRTIIEALFLNI